jgi:hypothetical protein
MSEGLRMTDAMVAEAKARCEAAASTWIACSGATFPLPADSEHVLLAWDDERDDWASALSGQVTLEWARRHVKYVYTVPALPGPLAGKD